MCAAPYQPTAFRLFKELFHAPAVLKGIKRTRQGSPTFSDASPTSENLSRHAALQHTREQQHRSNEKKQENDDINEVLTVLAVLDQWARHIQHTFFTQTFIKQLLLHYLILSERLSSIHKPEKPQNHIAMITLYTTTTLQWIEELCSLPMNTEEHLALLLLTAHFHEEKVQQALIQYLLHHGAEKTFHFLLTLSVHQLSFDNKTQYLTTLTNILLAHPQLIDPSSTHTMDDVDTHSYKKKTIKAALDKALYQQLIHPENTERKQLSLENLRTCLQSFSDKCLNISIEQLPDNSFTVTKNKKILRTYHIDVDHRGDPVLLESKKGKTYTINPALSEKKATLYLYQNAISKLTGSLKRTSRTPYSLSNQGSMHTQQSPSSITSTSPLPTDAIASHAPTNGSIYDVLKTDPASPPRSKSSRWHHELHARQTNTQHTLHAQKTLQSIQGSTETLREAIQALCQDPPLPK